MTIITWYGDLFDHGKDLERMHPDQVLYMHCISSDLAMGAGIAVPFNKKFHIREQFQAAFDHGIIAPNEIKHPTCIRTGSVLNLITKEKYWIKPTYDDLEESLRCAKHVMDNILKDKRMSDPVYSPYVVLPVIGCGLDKLRWPEVQKIIMKVFANYPVEFHVCVLR